jgi:hypothetical protein
MTDRTTPEVANLATARFDCVFPSCGGVCCKNGRPSVERDEERRIAGSLAKFLPHLTPRARARIERDGFVTARRKEGLPMLAVVDGWCVFANEGCVLHKVGAAEGDRFRYKPWRCAVFPLERDPRTGKWHVRQWGVEGEAWELFCLDPRESGKRASRTLAGELEHAAEVERRFASTRARGTRARPRA